VEVREGDRAQGIREGGGASLRRLRPHSRKPRGVLDINNEEAVLALIHDAIDIHVDLGELCDPFRNTLHFHVQGLYSQTAAYHSILREVLQQSGLVWHPRSALGVP